MTAKIKAILTPDQPKNGKYENKEKIKCNNAKKEMTL
jgi:hypothetical protein